MLLEHLLCSSGKAAEQKMSGHLCKIVLGVGQMSQGVGGELGGVRAPPFPTRTGFRVWQTVAHGPNCPDACVCRMVFTFLNDLF